MDCTQTCREFCPLTGQEISLTVSAQAEAGGYGCAVAAEDVEYFCSRQSGCPHAGSPSCPIHQM